MFESTKHLLSGGAKYAAAKLFLSPTESSDARVAQCNACELLGENRQCTVCQCFVDQKAKYQDEHCPIASVRSITGEYSANVDTLTALDKWGQTVRLHVPRGFASTGDIVAMPRTNQVVNLRTKQRIELSEAPQVTNTD